MSVHYVHPSAAVAASAGGEVLTEAQVESWREHGFAVVDGVVDEGLLRAAADGATARLPASGSAESDAVADFGAMSFEFPHGDIQALNEITLGPRMLGACAQLLGVRRRDLAISQSLIWVKYGRSDEAVQASGKGANDDQRFHADYPNHTLMVPPPWDQPEAVEIILYLSDEGETGGATAVAPRMGDSDPAYEYPQTRMPGFGPHKYINNRPAAEEYFEATDAESAAFRKDLYAREKRVKFKFGSVLFYRHDTWHRGTPLLPRSQRLVINMTYRLASSPWLANLHRAPAWSMYAQSQFMEKLVGSLSTDQLCALGFPQPGHPFWTQKTVDAVKKRYGCFGIDLSEFEAAL